MSESGETEEKTRLEENEGNDVTIDGSENNSTEPQEIESPTDPDKFTENAIVDVSPAFKELSDLQERGVVSPFKAAKLWSKYKDAFQLLESKRKRGEDLLIQVILIDYAKH